MDYGSLFGRDMDGHSLQMYTKYLTLHLDIYCFGHIVVYKNCVQDITVLTLAQKIVHNIYPHKVVDWIHYDHYFDGIFAK